MPHTQEIPTALYIVSTPIGNLEDITLRALRILKQVDLVAAEDTRHSKKLFIHYQIQQRLVSFHDHNKERVAPGLISHILGGKSLALISDAGTPGIADPAFYLVRAALKKKITVIPVPGPSAILSALVVSGLPTDRFIFENFLAPKSAKRIKRLEELGGEKRTVVVYESPHRIQKTLEDMASVLGETPVVICRELTKKFEEVMSGTPLSLLERIRTSGIKGEIVLLFNPGYSRKE